jgi:hypothetical protein
LGTSSTHTCFFSAGCDADALSSNSVFLTHEFSTDTQGKSIRFTFSSNDVSANRLNDISCNCSINIQQYIQSQGFQASDLVSATLVSADLIMLFPITKKVDFLSQAILKFTSAGNSVTEVANLSSFPATREVSLVVLPNRNIAAFLESANFGAILQLDPSTLGADESYDFSIIIKVRLKLSDGN